MAFSTSTSRRIARNFDRAALVYDQDALLQKLVAEKLVERSQPHTQPQDILDIGSGTGFALAAAQLRWPEVRLTALDQAPEMLKASQRKSSQVTILEGDAAAIDVEQKFDVIYSSMMLHWISDPRAALMKWRGWLKPQGKLYVALLTQGSFQEWAKVCEDCGVASGLWAMPEAHFADDLVQERALENLRMDFPSAQSFLKRLKAIGAATPRADHKPVAVSQMRRVLGQAPRPFVATYKVLYLVLSSQQTI